MKIIWNYIISTKSVAEDDIRKEKLLNVLLISVVVFSLIILGIYWIHRFYRQIKGLPTPGGAPQIVSAFSLMFLALFFFSKSGFHKFVAQVFVLMVYGAAVYSMSNWGVDIPQALLMIVLVMMLAGVLISNRAILLILVLVVLSQVVLGQLQLTHVMLPDRYWRSEIFGTVDIVIYGITLSLIAFLSWVSNREIEKSLYRARRSEAALKEEKDLLEVRVARRTEELRRLQMERVKQLYRFADFGRLASGLFHDLVNPLSMVAMNVQQLATGDTGKQLGRITAGLERMERYITAVRRQVQHEETIAEFSLDMEVRNVLEVVHHKARSARVELDFQTDGEIKWRGNQTRFGQVVTNLVANGIDAYEGVRRRKRRKVEVKLESNGREVLLKVEDFGWGMDEACQKRVFEPFFSTKPAAKGTGIGLHLTREIVEGSFGGSINFSSVKGEGTVFEVRIPLNNYTN